MYIRCILLLPLCLPLSSCLQFTLLICETFIHFCPRGKSIGDFQDAAELGKFNVLIDKFPYIVLIAVVQDNDELSTLFIKQWQKKVMVSIVFPMQSQSRSFKSGLPKKDLECDQHSGALWGRKSYTDEPSQLLLAPITHNMSL